MTTERGLTALPTVPTSVRSTNSAWDGIVQDRCKNMQCKIDEGGLERT